MIIPNPIELFGEWDEGYALDQHIQSSEYMGDDPLGKPTFCTQRTPIGELVFQLKYRGKEKMLIHLLKSRLSFCGPEELTRRQSLSCPCRPHEIEQLSPPFSLQILLQSDWNCNIWTTCL